jgi:hypothetical protein
LRNYPEHCQEVNVDPAKEGSDSTIVTVVNSEGEVEDTRSLSRYEGPAGP